MSPLINIKQASSMGFYAEECLGVQIRQGDPTFDGLTEVAEGRAILGNSWTSKVVHAHSAGTNITVIMQHFQRTGSRMVAELRPDIQQFSDLDNKTISLFVGSLNDMSAKAAIAKFDMRNVTIVQQGFTPYRLFASDDTKVSAVSVLVYNELAQLYEVVNPKTGVLFQPSELRILDFEDVGTAMLEDNVFASSEWLAVPHNQNIARRFVRATARGWIYCRTHELECVNMFSDHGPHQAWMMREVNRLIWPSQNGIGYIDSAALAGTIDVLTTTHALSGHPSSYPVSDNSYVEWALASLAADNDVYDIEATVCPPGFYAEAAGRCVQCLPGTYSSSNVRQLPTKQAPSSASAVPQELARHQTDEDAFIDLLRANVMLLSAWSGAITATGIIFFIAKRKFPTAHVAVIPNTVGAFIELILDIMFLRLLIEDPHPYYFAVAITAFSTQLALQTEFQQNSVRRWAEANANALPPVLMISVLNPELVEILSSGIGKNVNFTKAPFSQKGCAALRFCTFAAFIVGRAPQVCIEILILQRDGWHLSPFLACITNLALLGRGTIHYLLLNTLFLYKRRAADQNSSGVSGLFGVSIVDGIASLAGHGLEVDRLNAELDKARRRVRNLELRLGEHGKKTAGNAYESGPAGPTVIASGVLTETDHKKTAQLSSSAHAGIAFHRISNMDLEEGDADQDHEGLTK
ncbi:hypothetical protein HDU86_007009 [Geranomyces michiganensis]|nr:hypothetical protein HDU86_007009 [Geranomyces michiganensis]